MSYHPRGHILIEDFLFFENHTAYIEYKSDSKTFCFNILNDEEDYIEAFCIGVDGVTSPGDTNVCVVNTEPIEMDIVNTVGITTLQTLDVDTGLTEIAINNFPAIQEISTTQTIDVDTSLTEIAVNNFPAIQEISTTQTIDVDTGLTEIAVNNFPAIQEISTTQTIDVDTGLTEIAVNNFPAIQEISTTQTIDVDTGLTEIAVNNFPAIQEINTTQTIDVDTGLTEIAVNNFPAIQEISTTQTIDVDTGLTEIAVNNFPAIQEINTTQTIDVDTGLTEIAISSFPVDNLNVNIAEQTLADIQISSNNLPIATENTLLNINRNVNPYIGINPLEEKLFSQAKCIYQSNHKGLNSVSYNTINFLENENILNTDVTYTDYGIEIDHQLTLPNLYERSVNFYTYIGGRTLYIYDFSNVDFSNLDDIIYEYEFGLRDWSQGKHLSFFITCDGTTPSTSSISIVIAGTTITGGNATETILQSQFNIDQIDGTGPSNTNPSGYNYTLNWLTNKFFILTDDKTHYTFGLINNYNLIAIHSWSQNIPVSTEPLLFRANRPYFLSRKLDTIQRYAFDFLGFTIYKDTLPNYKIMHNITNSKLAIDTSSVNVYPLVSLRYANTFEYDGNIQLKDIFINTNKILRFTVIYGTAYDSIQQSATWGETIGNLDYDIAATSYLDSSGTIINSFIVNSGVNEISLVDIVDWKLFGYNESHSYQTQLLFGFKNLGSGTADVEYSLNFWQF